SLSLQINKFINIKCAAALLDTDRQRQPDNGDDGIRRDDRQRQTLPQIQLVVEAAGHHERQHRAFDHDLKGDHDLYHVADDQQAVQPDPQQDKRAGQYDMQRGHTCSISGFSATSMVAGAVSGCCCSLVTSGAGCVLLVSVSRPSTPSTPAKIRAICASTSASRCCQKVTAKLSSAASPCGTSRGTVRPITSSSIAATNGIFSGRDTGWSGESAPTMLIANTSRMVIRPTLRLSSITAIVVAPRL